MHEETMMSPVGWFETPQKPGQRAVHGSGDVKAYLALRALNSLGDGEREPAVEKLSVVFLLAQGNQ